MRLDGIVLDLDDTLYDTTGKLLPWADRRAAATLRASGLGLPEDEVLRRIADLRAAGCTTVFRDLVAAAGGSPTAAAAAEESWFAYDPPPLHLDEDVDAALAALARLAPLALLTSGHPETQRRKIARLGIAPRFAACRVVDFRDPAGKTGALASLLAERAWEPSRTVMAGDRPDGDVRAGNRNGCRTVLVRRPGGEYGTVPVSAPEDRPWRTIAHVRELPALLRAED